MKTEVSESVCPVLWNSSEFVVSRVSCEIDRNTTLEVAKSYWVPTPLENSDIPCHKLGALWAARSQELYTQVSSAEVRQWV
jgi:hypothetical protein